MKYVIILIWVKSFMTFLDIQFVLKTSLRGILNSERNMWDVANVGEGEISLCPTRFLCVD